jgi:hypothetical protein
MPLSIDIRLPKNVKPVFPNRCVYSGEVNPDSEVFLIVNSQNPFLSFLAPILLLFGWRRVRAPIHRRHKLKFYLQNYGRDIVMFVLVCVLMWKIMPSFSKGSFRKFKVAGMVLAALSPWIFFEVFFPRRFNVTAGATWIEYEFASHEYAAEFHELNAASVLKSEI